MNPGLTGRRFAVAGAASALGSAVSRVLADAGSGLLLLGRSREKIESLRASLAEPSRHALAQTDIEHDPDGLFETIVHDAQANGPLSGGVYCPGVGPLLPLRAIKASAIEAAFRVNYVGAQLFVKALASKNARQPEGGSIVLIASVAGLRGNKGLSIYSASKAALVVGARSLALELADLRIRVNCVSPGWFESPLADSSLAWHPGGREEVGRLCPLGIGTPNDVAGAITYLLSDAARWVTGTNLVVDGGYLA